MKNNNGELPKNKKRVDNKLEYLFAFIYNTQMDDKLNMTFLYFIPRKLCIKTKISSSQ